MVSVFRLINKAKQQRDIFVDKKLVQSISLLPLQQREPKSNNFFSQNVTSSCCSPIFYDIQCYIPERYYIFFKKILYVIDMLGLDVEITCICLGV